jgi:hypothetical protein
MHKLIEIAGRRSAGLAAGVILTGGLVGGVLMAPAAYAAVDTTTTVTATAQGSAIIATVTVSPTGTTGFVSVSDGAGGGCHTFGSGSCTISNVANGPYTVTASYEGFGGFAPSSGSTTVTVTGGPTTPPTPPPGSPPVFTADSPSTSLTGQSFSYQFQATNSPSFTLINAPSWLGISNSGWVSGNVPDWVTSFSFQVEASNASGNAFTPEFTIFRHHNFFNFEEVNLSTSLSCTSPVFTGQRGTCTLWVSNSDQDFFWGPGGQFNNFGQDFASDVTARISLPPQLRADFCRSSNSFNFNFFNGCQIFDNTATADLGNLRPGQTRSLTVVFTAQSGFNLFGWHPGHRFFVRVVGSASSGHDNFNFFGRGESFSTAYVHIIPRGFWW